MTPNELRDTSYEIAKSKGWHDPDLKRSFADLMALVISELAEALEEYRAGKPPREIEFRKPGDAVVWYRSSHLPLSDAKATLQTGLKLIEAGYKPEGVVIELADAAIRIGDAAGAHDIELKLSGDLRDYFVERENDAAVLGQWICRTSWELAVAAGESQCGCNALYRSRHLTRALATVCRMAHWLGITGEEFERAIEIKHAYNRGREFRHGGKLL